MKTFRVAFKVERAFAEFDVDAESSLEARQAARKMIDSVWPAAVNPTPKLVSCTETFDSMARRGKRRPA